MSPCVRQRGFTALELLAALVMAMALMLVTLPPLAESLRNARLRAAARQLSSELRQVRSMAVGTGWDYRVAGVSAGSGGVRRNQYRIMGRDPALSTWPPEETLPFESLTLVVGEWRDLDGLFPGVAINPSDSDDFAVTFDARGVPIERTLNFDPLELTNKTGAEKYLTVSSVGNVRID